VTDYLPELWLNRTKILFEGSALTLLTLGRLDLLMTKCWAYCDRSKDLEDILSLKPTVTELQVIEEWLKPLDGNPDWPSHVSLTLNHIRIKIDKERQ
jgi:hypothetical protein